jgi:hypothetical protein
MLFPEGTKLVKALCLAVPARSALLPSCSGVVLPTPEAPRTGITRSPPSHSRRTARFCSGWAPARRVPPGAHLHSTARRHAPHDTKPSRQPRWDFAYHAETSGTRQPQGLPRQAADALRTFCRCKSNWVRRLHGLAGKIRSLAPRLLICRPVRQPSPGPRAEGPLSSGSGNDRPQAGTVPHQEKG